MKKVLLFAAMLTVSVTLSAQSKGFNKLFEKYSGRDGITAIQMSGDMMKGMMGDDANMNAVAEGLENMVILVAENPPADFKADVDKMIKEGGYKTIMNVVDGEDKVMMYSAKLKKKTEFIMLVMDEEDYVVMCFVGDEDIDLSKMSSMINM